MLFDYRVAAFAFAATCSALALSAPTPAQTGRVGSHPCSIGHSGIRVAVTGLKDRTGTLRLEVYPAFEADFLEDGEVLLRAGKVFRRIVVPVPADGPIGICVATPGPGQYAIVVIHDRHGAAKFSITHDGVGVPGQNHVGRRRPRLVEATVTVAGGISSVATRMQYLRGLTGFGPVQS